MTLLHNDLETIPAQAEWVKEEIAANIKPPGNIKKPESIEKWHAEKGAAAIEAEWLKTSFNGAVGEIICIGYAFDDEEVRLVGRELGMSEGDMLQAFVDDVVRYDTKSKFQWIGHYICGFDLRFLWKRMIINKITLPFDIPYSAKPWHESVYDTCHEWKGDDNGYGSLDAVMKCLGMQGKSDMDGSMVWPEIKAGNYEKVFDYCKDDVGMARNIHHRLKGLPVIEV